MGVWHILIDGRERPPWPSARVSGRTNSNASITKGGKAAYRGIIGLHLLEIGRK
ncbi:hypothetical protein SAMN04487769_0055 [Burkholderia sp. b14]|nr:hypothetical protein SAMN04487769_0055 [Burkholderia sp. b14]